MVGRKKNWRVYLLRCAGGSLYAGITKDVAARVLAHEAGKGAKYTRSHLPVSLVWSSAAMTEGEARRAEAAIKRLSKAEKEGMVAQNKVNPD